MERSKMTSGPWTAAGVTVYCGGNGARLTVADTRCAGSMTRDEDEANARAIAAVPDLIEALRDYALPRLMEANNAGGPGTAEALRVVRAALCKAGVK